MRDFELVINDRQDGKLMLEFSYRQGKFCRQQVEQWVAAYIAHLESFAAAESMAREALAQ
ncbi:hypothetical protein CAL65_14640 [Alkalilimnicola ehrlichii]|uniref:Uncharacterized protein n=2 Tax=Alkalilimnicola ehrlichii TaxID=351052 RepID=A0A3E0WNP9_9GAMM|nr:hypothetical protein CAL65_14640 [Alkalilimnicola ehrlichii]